ncbi:hypothetical protein [Acuticoccus sp.]|uniref:hypothetical protein n=1 Tax=Acuticoccus sp. TaxID=1904378 RepID=UPI003B521E82
MTAPRQLWGVSLLKNEDRVAAWALGNVAPLLDRLLVLDNRSTDRTGEVLRRLAAKHSHVEVIEVGDAYDTHRYVEDWAGRNVWVLAVDGDEVYDREGLARLRPRLLDGEFDAHWRVTGHTLHLTGGDLGTVGIGHATPPAKSAARLYNFDAISSWPSGRSEGRHQRLHGKTMTFREGYGIDDILRLASEEPWEASDLRTLHLCFMPRSSQRGFDQPGRANAGETHRAARPLQRLEQLARRAVGLAPPAPTYKASRYAVGDIVTRPLQGFGLPSDHLDIDPEARTAEAVLRAALAPRPHLAEVAEPLPGTPALLVEPGR